MGKCGAMSDSNNRLEARVLGTEAVHGLFEFVRRLLFCHLSAQRRLQHRETTLRLSDRFANLRDFVGVLNLPQTFDLIGLRN